MSKPQVNILNFTGLYNILFELRDVLKFDVLSLHSEEELIRQNKEVDAITVTNKKITNNNIALKNIIVLNDIPIKLIDLIDKINTNLLKQKYSFQSNFNIKNYKLDLNSRVMSYEKKDLKLTEREIEIILFLNNKKLPQKIEILQKEVWGYSENLETHTVETHVYRLRKKINEKFNDENFLISTKDGYKI